MKLKNLSSVILAAMMAATSVPAASLIAPYNNLSAYAVETAEPEEEAPIAWGMCGENLTWEVFAEEDSLVIDGTGAMTEWESAEDAPWAEYGDRISLIVIRENVESISENAFGATRGRIFFFNSYDCVIPDNETFLPENASIYGYDGSTAQAYAEKYGREFTSEGEYVGPSDENISSDENNSSDEDDSTVIEGDRVVAEGICGENLKWEIDSLEDILIISGYGEMTDWEKPEDAPWFEYSDEFDIVIIRPGVAEISENSFGSNVKIVYLTSYNCVIPDSETAIPADALIIGYYNSTAQAYAKKYNREFDQLNDEGEEFPLMEGVCTENLEWILWDDGSLAFYGYGDIVAENGVYPWDVVADSVKEITISTAVRSIGENAFTNCTNLESVLMYTPDCKIADSADVFPSDVLLQVGDGSTAEEYAIKYNLTYDVYNFFTASGKIGDNLSWLLINGGSLRIYGVGDMIDLGGESPWAEYEDEITRVQINEEVTSIDKAAFEGCDNIADMIVLNPNCKFAESEDAIPEDVVIWGAEGSGALMYAQMFGRDFKILSLDIVAPEEEEESYIAYGELGENLTWTLHDDGSIYINGEGEMLECGEGGYPWSEFADKIKNVELGKEVTSIGAYAFYNCINLESMHLAPVIGEHAYDGCINAGGVGYYSDLSVNEIGDYAFNNCGFFSYEFINPDCVIADSEFVFPTNATIWGYVGSTAQAHAEKYGLEFVEITSGEQQGVAEGELGDNLYWTLDDGNLNIIGNGDMIEIDGVYPWDEYADQIKTVFVNENVTSISTGAFDNCANVQDVWVFNIDCVIADVDNIFPANAEIYGYNGSTTQAYAEKYNKNFVALMRTVADGKLGENLSWLIDEGGAININGIGDMIEIDGVYPWDEYADQITTVNVLGDVTSISAGAFDNCANIEAVWIHNRDCVIADVDNVFPANAEIYGYNGSAAQAYAEKYNKTFIALRKEIVGGEFGEDFEWSILDDGTIFISGIGEMPEFEAGCYPWSDYSDMIKNVELAKEVTSIGAYAFYNCINLESMHLASVIGEHAYDGCINVGSVSYASDLIINEIGDYAFNNCGFTSYTITNPDCVIADSEFVFPSGADIWGYAGSTAQAHAEKYGLEFVEIEGEPVTTTVTTAPDSDSTTTTTTTTANDSESELPQTGFSRAYDYLAFSAGVMALCGIYAMKKGKKKEDEE